jgi:hypothetical protein
LSHFNAVP